MCLLKKSLYGLKQSPRQWYRRFDTYVLKIGFQRSSYDGCLYYKKLSNGKLLLLLIYVDDMLLASESLNDINKVKELLKAEFDMKDLGGARKILGMEVSRFRDKRVLVLSQKSYLEKVLKRFSMFEAKPVQIPLAAHFKFTS